MVNRDVYICQHIGLGDCIMNNGMVRYFAKQYRKVYTYSKHEYKDTVAYMFRDMPNVEVVGVENDNEQLYRIHTKNNDADVVRTGYTGKDWHTLYENQKVPVSQQIRLDWMFYYQAGIPLDVKWDMFYVERDMEKEMEIFNRFKSQYGIEEGKYIFIHDTSKQAYTGFSRGGVGGEIDRDLIEDKTLPIIIPEPIKFNMFHYRYIVENAAELHMINSSFFNMADLIETKGKLFYHIYPRPYDCLTSRKPWTKLYKDVVYD